jgi:catechol 2,3-dioxygenase-like lactoylglutathione lyase family enzyme
MSLFTSSGRTSTARIACLVVLATTLVLAQGAPTVTPEGSLVQKVWHLGRVTGDLHRIIDFYHDVIGLNLRGARSPIPFYSVAAINEFVNAPAHAEFRAAFLPIQGTSAATVAADQIYLEAFEYRNIDRRQVLPPLTSPGASSLRLLVRDLNAVIAKAKAANVSVLTAGGEAVAVPAPAGMTGTARAVMLRDPDGYPVELMEISPPLPTFAPAESPVLGAHMVVVVDDLAASLKFYRRLVGTELQASAPSAWQPSAAVSRLRAIPDLASRTASIRLPGSAIALELVEYRDAPPSTYRPAFQDIGHGHVAFIVKDIQETVQRMKAAGATSISKAGTWTQINPTTRAVYTRDPDGFFLEILERR